MLNRRAPFLTRLKGFQRLTPIIKAQQVFFAELTLKPPRTTIIALRDALNRVSSEDIIAREDLPRFDRSAVDGYAIKAKDTIEASQFKPKILKITERNEVNAQQARQVWTGNPIPKGANAVIMLENTKRIDDRIEAWSSLTPGENVSMKGEDVKKDEVVVTTGTRFKPQHLGLIAALGIKTVKVAERPKVAVFATGNELVEAGAKLDYGKVFETNRLVISAMCQELGAEPIDLGIVKDEIDEISKKLESAIAKADAVITTGGTSVGASDLVPLAADKVGKPGVIVHGIAMRPAMPTALAIVENKPVLILSGNPVAAMIGFEVFARPLIQRMLGVKRESRPTIKAKMTRKVATTLGRKTFVRVHVFQKSRVFLAEPVSARGSGAISTMTRANGYVIVPENREGLCGGEKVTVFLFDETATGDGDV
jgi:molybdopterin molybdotransferase